MKSCEEIVSNISGMESIRKKIAQVLENSLLMVLEESLESVALARMKKPGWDKLATAFLTRRIRSLEKRMQV